MSGPGDIGGEVSGDEAAWRDLIARFDGTKKKKSKKEKLIKKRKKRKEKKSY